MANVSKNILDESLSRMTHVDPDISISTSTDGTEFDLDDDLEDETFELPLKTRTKLAQSTNFADLTPMISPDKKVRFQNHRESSPWLPLSEDKMSDLDRQFLDNPRIGRTIRKPHIEDVLLHAQSLNRYLDQNMSKITSFQADMYDQEHESSFPRSHNFASNVATAPTTPSGSVSNFQLSVGDSGDAMDESTSDNDGLSGAVLQNDNETEDRKIKQLLSTHQTATYPLSENLSTFSLSRDDLQSRNDSLNFAQHVDASSYTSISSLTNDLMTMPNSPVIRNTDFIEPHISVPRLLSEPENDLESNEQPPDMSSEVALALYTTTITALLEISKNNNIVAVEVLPSFVAFEMKSAPTLAYEEYLQRLQMKFSFAPVVYLTAAHLLQILALHRNASDHHLSCKFRLDLRQVHRLVIASIRLATKLLEDCVHSHTYFSRICGISKRLLTKLEVSLLECLQYEGLKITNKSLINAAQTHQELCEMTK
ncbi:LANO_0E03642g1_1 [Lachancea nothofagi CBS 11611]|uniref:LANO_0E03642g1_1 n=1 Tax=Lachancea nothofagi CBS 11611 TaxID=1266666 RepID=A0A1G4JR92_9SACH|nr:LANO_0E03642g1_1 [Lachancea nothofagi CBS 11611]